MTSVAARDLAQRLIRVCTIAPGAARLGHADGYAALAAHIIENQMLAGETIRRNGAVRMHPRSAV